MARKQSDYLQALLSSEPEAPSPELVSAGSPAERTRGGTLRGRESTLARLASGEVRQVTQLLLDPARVRVWPGNARHYAHLTEENCRELIDSIVAEGGQKVPAVVRRVEGDPAYDYEVIAGTRRHWSIRWLRAHHYPEMQFVAQVAILDDEAAFRLADLENRARKDVSDLERARNYAQALKDHYSNHLTGMADRLKLSKGWLSKMVRVASLPDELVSAFASPADISLRAGYALATAFVAEGAARPIMAEAAMIAKEQAQRRASELPAIQAADVTRRLLEAPTKALPLKRVEPLVLHTAQGRPALTVQSANRQGVNVRLHAGTGLTNAAMLDLLREALGRLDDQGRGLQR